MKRVFHLAGLNVALLLIVALAAQARSARLSDFATGPVFDSRFAFDGKRLLTAEPGPTLWDMTTGQPLQVFHGHTDEVQAVAFSPDGRQVLTGAGHSVIPPKDTSIRLWDADTGMELRRFESTSSVGRLQFSPDGTRVFSIAGRGAEVWDVHTGRQVLAVAGGRLFSLDGRRLLGTNDKGTIVTSYGPGGQALCTIPIPAAPVFSTQFSQFSPDASLVVIPGPGTTRTWDAETCRPVQVFAGDTVYVVQASFIAGGRSIITASLDRSARLWDARSGRELRRYEHPGGVEAMLVSRDGTRLLTRWAFPPDYPEDSHGQGGCASLWDVESGREIRRFCPELDKVGLGISWQRNGLVGFSPDGGSIAVVTPSGIPAALFNAHTGELIRQYRR